MILKVREPDPEDPVTPAQPEFLAGPLEDCQLLPQSEILGDEAGTVTQDGTDEDSERSQQPIGVSGSRQSRDSSRRSCSARWA
jgi:hypothetical protein